MKRNLLYTLVFAFGAFAATAQTTIFSQNFNSPATEASIVGSGQNQFAAVGTTAGTGSNDANFALVSGQAVLGKNVDGNGAAKGFAFLSKNGLASSGKLVCIKFDMDFTGVAGTSAIQLLTGTGLSADGKTDDATDPLKLYTRITFNTLTSDAFVVRANASSNATTSYTGAQVFRAFFNVTAEPQTYTGPDGASYNLAAKKYNVWIGNVRQQFPYNATANNENGVGNPSPNYSASNPSVAFTDFKLTITGGASATVAASLKVDNMEVIDHPVVLPVSLTSFTGKWNGRAAELNWQTASEQNNSHFEILRATDGKAFSQIDIKGGKGTTQETSNYSYTDNTALAGINYYKLRQVDFDGKSKEYDAISIKNPLTNDGKLTAYLTKDAQLALNINSLASGNASIEVRNISANAVYNGSVTLNEGANQFTLPVANIAKGVYIVVVKNGSVAQSVKFVK